MTKYILSVACVLSVFLGCEQTPAVAVEKPPPGVEIIAITKISGLPVTVESVHDGKRGVTCYISVIDISGVSSGTHMTCLPDVWISGKAPVPVIAPQDAQQVK